MAEYEQQVQTILCFYIMLFVQHFLWNISYTCKNRRSSCERVFTSLQTADMFPVVASLPPKHNVWTQVTKRFPLCKTFVANHSLALKIKELTCDRLLTRSCTVDMFTSRNWRDNVACVQPPFFLRATHSRRLIYPDCETDWWNKHQEDSYWRED